MMPHSKCNCEEKEHIKAKASNELFWSQENGVIQVCPKPLFLFYFHIIPINFPYLVPSFLVSFKLMNALMSTIYLF